MHHPLFLRRHLGKRDLPAKQIVACERTTGHRRPGTSSSVLHGRTAAVKTSTSSIVFALLKSAQAGQSSTSLI
jgi:hypothetical protein